MTARSKTQQPICIYCGIAEATTVDHIPPKCLFPKPRPSNLITVPACEPCNSGFQLDDEYFKTAMAIRWDVSDHPAVSGGLLDSILRSLDRDEAQSFRKLFTDTLQPAPIVTHGGIYVEEGARFEADIDRIYGVVKRIVRALHYTKFGEHLPASRPIIVIDDETLEQKSEKLRMEILRSFRPILQGDPKVFGAETFLYFGGPVPEHPDESAWFLVFFSRVIFFATTTPDMETGDNDD